MKLYRRNIHEPEAGVLDACKELLECMRIYYERKNTGRFFASYKRKRDGKQVRRAVGFGKEGMADLFAIPWVRRVEHVGDVEFAYITPLILWIETKGSGGEQSGAQKAFQADVESRGHYYLLAHSVDDLIDWLRKHGVQQQ